MVYTNANAFEITDVQQGWKNLGFKGIFWGFKKVF